MDPQSPTSSIDSFHTASTSPVGANSLPRSMETLSRRPVVPIHDDVRQEINIYFDEELYSSAITLLTDLITAGTYSTGIRNSIYVPSPLHIELVSALLIHPRYTNQAPVQERTELPTQSITFLRNLLAILGPIDANLAEAFSFSVVASRSSRRSRNALDWDDGSNTSESDDGPDRIKGLIANKGRIRNCAQDFWHMVGWAFNCSVRHPKRWKYWKVWLDFMLDVLDADWYAHENSKSHSGTRDSLLLRYLSEAKGRSSAMKRVVRSAFANGSLESLKEFPEVFVNETKELKAQNRQKRKRDEPGRTATDFDTDEAETSEQTSSDQDDMPDLDPWSGGPESMILRQRVIVLLSRASDAHPDDFYECTSVYDAMQSNIKHLPLPAFTLFLSPSPSSRLYLPVYVSMTQLVLLRLLPTTAPRPEDVSREKNDQLNQDVLEQCYLPFPAQTSSVAENAKVSILAENLLRLLYREGLICHTPTLDAAVEQGIVAREEKAKGDKRKRDKGMNRLAEDNEMSCLKASGKRLRSILSWIEERDGK